MENEATEIDASATLWGYLLMAVGVLLFMLGMFGGALIGVLGAELDIGWIPWLGAAFVVVGLVIVFGEDESGSSTTSGGTESTGEAEDAGGDDADDAGEETPVEGSAKGAETEDVDGEPEDSGERGGG